MAVNVEYIWLQRLYITVRNGRRGRWERGDEEKNITNNCVLVYDITMCEVAKKLPLVEEFHVTFDYFSENVLEVLGKSCPLLKSLKYVGISWKTDVKYDDDALAIAKRQCLHYVILILMEIRLVMLGWPRFLMDEPLHNTFDIQECHTLDLDFSGDLWERCHDQIKDLRFFANDSNYFSDFDATMNMKIFIWLHLVRIMYMKNMIIYVNFKMFGE